MTERSNANGAQLLKLTGRLLYGQATKIDALWIILELMERFGIVEDELRGGKDAIKETSLSLVGQEDTSVRGASVPRILTY